MALLHMTMFYIIGCASVCVVWGGRHTHKGVSLPALQVLLNWIFCWFVSIVNNLGHVLMALTKAFLGRLYLISFPVTNWQLPCSNLQYGEIPREWCRVATLQRKQNSLTFPWQNFKFPWHATSWKLSLFVNFWNVSGNFKSHCSNIKGNLCLCPPLSQPSLVLTFYI